MRLDEILAQKKQELAALTAKTAPLRAKRDKLRDKLAPMEAELRELNQQIKQVEGNTLFDLHNDIGALQRGLGAKSLRAEGMK
jgi:uncharacterized coiled-coil DUF342 family protein